VIVVGAGLAGLATGWRLARRGASVTLVDRAPRAGGRLCGERQDGFALSPALGTVCEADRRLLAFVKEVGLAEEWLPLRPVSLAIAQKGKVRDVALRGLKDVRSIPGVGLRQALRLVRLPRLLARYADALDFENPAGAARLDDRSIGDFGRLYFGRSVLEGWIAPRAERSAPGDLQDMSRVQFLIDEHRKGSARVGLPRGSFDEVVERLGQWLEMRLCTEVLQVETAERGGARVMTSAGVLEADAVVLATDAIEAERLGAPVLVTAERRHLAAVRYAPLLSMAAGLCRPASTRPRELWVPRPENSPLSRVLFEPGVAAGRVPASRGLAWLRARSDFFESSRNVSDDVVSKQLVEALDRLMPGWLRTVDFTRVFRCERAAPRFDVGHYRGLANFESVQLDRRQAGRALYFVGDHLIHPSPEGAVVSAERAAAALGADLALP
jgi:oxygen-dependent protoporphyrinogen oxidase